MISEEVERVPLPGADGVMTMKIVPRQYTASKTQRRRRKALSIIRMSISNDLIPHIRNETDPAAAWATLARLFESRGNSQRLFLKIEEPT